MLWQCLYFGVTTMPKSEPRPCWLCIAAWVHAVTENRPSHASFVGRVHGSSHTSFVGRAVVPPLCWVSSCPSTCGACPFPQKLGALTNLHRWSVDWVLREDLGQHQISNREVTGHLRKSQVSYGSSSPGPNRTLGQFLQCPLPSDFCNHNLVFLSWNFV